MDVRRGMGSLDAPSMKELWLVGISVKGENSMYLSRRHDHLLGARWLLLVDFVMLAFVLSVVFFAEMLTIEQSCLRQEDHISQLSSRAQSLLAHLVSWSQ